jgi:integrase
VRNIYFLFNFIMDGLFKLLQNLYDLLLPCRELPLNILKSWIDYLTKELLFSPDEPLFPKTKIENNGNIKFEATGLLREHWQTASPIREIFKQAFQNAGLPYYNPHSFRNTLVRLGENLCQTPEQFKAWSQNLGHEGVLTTFYSYGDVEDYRQAELLRKLREPIQNLSADFDAFIEAKIRKMM